MLRGYSVRYLPGGLCSLCKPLFFKKGDEFVSCVRGKEEREVRTGMVSSKHVLPDHVKLSGGFDATWRWRREDYTVDHCTPYPVLYCMGRLPVLHCAVL